MEEAAPCVIVWDGRGDEEGREGGTSSSTKGGVEEVRISALTDEEFDILEVWRGSG